MRSWVFPAVLLTGCGLYGGNYVAAGSAFVGKRVSLACIDLAIASSDDPLASGPVIAYTFGNRCFHGVDIDLSAVRAIGLYGEQARPLHASDPRHELRSVRLDAISRGTEQIEYQADDFMLPTAICLDASAIERGAVAQAQWICFRVWRMDPVGSAGGVP